MTQTLISVIVPCYNQAQYLDECLQSVLDQTYERWECIIVNDGSPDNTEEVAKIWIEKDSRFKYLYKENGGLSSARNAGIEIAQGKWILPLDSDDKIGNRYLELAQKEFDDYNLIYCKANLFGIVEAPLINSDFSYEQLLYKNPFFCSAIFKKKFWKTVGGYDVDFVYGYEDWEFFINIVYNITDIKVLKLDYVGFFYRRKEISMDIVINSDASKKKGTLRLLILKHAKHYANSLDYIQQQFKEVETLKYKNKEFNQILFKNKISYYLFRIIKALSKKHD